MSQNSSAASDGQKSTEVTPFKPERFEKDMRGFAESDRANPPEPGRIVCIGSSSMGRWHTMEADLAPLSVLPRGFPGNSMTMHDAVKLAHRIVLPYKPRAVLLYNGDNDIAMLGAKAEIVMGWLNEFLNILHSALPETRVYIISVKPSIKRWEHWPEMQRVSRMYKEKCDSDPRLTYINIADALLDKNGELQHDIYVADNSHLNEKGYALWADAIRPVLMDGEYQYESRAGAQ